MNNNWCSKYPDQTKLLEIISAQAEITKVGPDLGTVMSLVAQKAQSLTSADGATVELAENGEMVYRAVSGSLSAFLGLRLAQDGSLSGMSVRENSMMFSADTHNDGRVDKNACIKVNARSMVVVPLTYETTCVGVLKVVSPKPSFFSDQDYCTLSLISNMLSSAMYHAARYAVDDLFIRATSDPLTKLKNRAAFYDTFRRMLHETDDKNTRMGLMIIDMDGLKYINDTYGHRAGDAAITSFADVLRTAYKKDCSARLGGDEFAVLIDDMPPEEEAEKISGRIHELTSEPLSFESHSIALDASAGLAVYPDNAKDISSMMEYADKAMYAVKKSKKTCRDK